MNPPPSYSNKQRGSSCLLLSSLNAKFHGSTFPTVILSPSQVRPSLASFHRLWLPGQSVHNSLAISSCWSFYHGFGQRDAQEPTFCHSNRRLLQRPGLSGRPHNHHRRKYCHHPVLVVSTPVGGCLEEEPRPIHQRASSSWLPATLFLHEY
jgi:hypothetical protein